MIRQRTRVERLARADAALRHIRREMARALRAVRNGQDRESEIDALIAAEDLAMAAMQAVLADADEVLSYETSEQSNVAMPAMESVN